MPALDLGWSGGRGGGDVDRECYHLARPRALLTPQDGEKVWKWRSWLGWGTRGSGHTKHTFPVFSATEAERVGLWVVCSLFPAATYVPVRCSPGPCFLCSCKMETFERGGNSFYVSFWSTVKEHEDGGEGQKKKKTEQWILKHARKTKMETMVS